MAWSSQGSPGSDASSFSVQAQRYLPEPGFVPSFCAALALLFALARRRWISPAATTA